MSTGMTARPRRRAGVRDRVVELERVRARELAENPKNWRRHPAPQRAALRGLLRQIGYADALLARRDGEALVLVDGHLRRSLDPEQVVPVLVLDLDESEADMLLATLDPLAALAEPDPEALARLLASVHASSAAVQALLDGLARGAGLPVAAPLADPEQIPPLPPKPRTRRGDIWSLGEHRLMCGDARSSEDMGTLMEGERAEVLWTDPPYGVGYEGKTRSRLRIAGDEEAGVQELLRDSFAAAGAFLSPGARIYVAHPAGRASLVFLQAFTDQGWRLHQSLVWVKDVLVLGHGDYHYRHEPILYGYAPGPGRWGRGAKGWYGDNTQTSVLEVPRPAASRDHPTAKPVELVTRCLRNSSGRGDRVLDPFAGSGAVLIAAELLGRRAFAVELDPAYCDVVLRRWEQVTGHRAVRLRRSRRPRARRLSAG
jgi:DNA modification methylase